MKITEDPIQEIIVHELYKMDLKDLVLQRIRPDGRPIMLYWCDGIAYSLFGLGEKAWDAEMLKGKMHFTKIYYADMPEYKALIEINTEQFGGLKIPVIDTSSIELDRELVKFLKSRKKSGK
ncbi:MAG: hypothetical protein M1528_00760 [Candidatus Marsarchaeota archaeon]|jgi:hypothetical protein|nr:hypothetical protein [Candidatus Marsarchaeota archaeon]